MYLSRRLILTLWFISMVSPLDQPDLFSKSQKIDKLVIKNQIGYHFKRIVREVSQELFISRKIDVSALFVGIQVLQQAQDSLLQYCVKISETTKAYANRKHQSQGMAIKPPPARFVHVATPSLARFAEARAMCEARKMRLPELYQKTDINELSSFLQNNKIPSCFAGLVPDPAEATFRFISTGIPIWKGPFDVAYDRKGTSHTILSLMDDSNVKFVYSPRNTLGARFDSPTPIGESQGYAHPRYRDRVNEISDIQYPIVCEERWDGISFPTVRKDTIPGTVIYTHRRKRSILSSKSTNPGGEVEEDASKNLREYCYSIVSLAEDTRTEMFSKLTSLLSLVDISVHMENTHGLQARGIPDDLDSDSEILDRQKRVIPLFLAKAVFTNGFKLIWGLFGIIDKMRTERRLKKMEKNIANVQIQAAENSNLIKNLSQVAYGNSIAIQQLNITTKELKTRVANLEHRVDDLTLRVDQTVNLVDSTIMISLIASLIERIQQSMNSGYDVLKDIIHCSLLGQTSPLLLPLDQIDVVQNKVRKVSTSVLDPDFIKMQSIIVSDPNDPHLLLVIINAVALSRENVDLVELVSIPYYENGKAFFPILDYQTVVLNQLKRSYSILEEQEEISCLSNRCYISDVERPVSDKTCGIPQFFDEHLDACIADETPTTGVFLKPMLPDGILFAFQDEVTSQLFCQGAATGASKKLQGTGIMQLPNGCLLSLVDKKGVSTKVKGPPIYRIMDADDLALIVTGPLSSTQSQGSQSSIHKKATYDGMITSHLSPVFQKMLSSDHKLDTQSTYIWSLLGVLIFVSILVIVILLLLYRYSTRFRQKVRDLRDRVAEVSHQVVTMVRNAESMVRGLPPPNTPLSPRVSGLLASAQERLARVEASAKLSRPRPPSPYMSSGGSSPGSKDNTYISFRPVAGLPRGNHAHPYPHLSPLLQRAFSEYETQELDRESEEVRELSKLAPKVTSL
jgi:hypothetical protein